MPSPRAPQCYVLTACYHTLAASLLPARGLISGCAGPPQQPTSVPGGSGTQPQGSGSSQQSEGEPAWEAHLLPPAAPASAARPVAGAIKQGPGSEGVKVVASAAGQPSAGRLPQKLQDGQPTANGHT